MERTITAGGKPYKIRASAGALVIYKTQFGRDYPEELAELKENDEEGAVVLGCRLLWAMARTVKEKLPTPDEWIAAFKRKELEEALLISRQLFAMSLGEQEDSGDPGSEFTAERLVAEAALCGMSIADLCIMPLSMVIKTIEEYISMRYGDGDNNYVSAAEFFGE